MYVVDIETDKLDATKIHCLSVGWLSGGEWKIKTTYDYDEMRKLMLKEGPFIFHDGLRFDIPVLERILGITITGEVFDTLPMSWGLYPYRGLHGLEAWGEDLGIPKVEVPDEEWEKGDPALMRERCETDTRIGKLLWDKMWADLSTLYGGDKERIMKYIRYLCFKMQQVRDQAYYKVPVNRETIQKNLDWFYAERKPMWDALVEGAPANKKMVKRKKPAKMHLKDGSLSTRGGSWIALLDEMKLPHDTEEVEVVATTEPFNPNSTAQIKAWLFDLGWEPCTYEMRKAKSGVNKVPQVTDDNGELTDSVKLLAAKDPLVKNLENLGILKHRIGLLKGFLECEEDGFLISSVSGFTKTLRLKHKKPIANLPKVTGTKGIEDGFYIRGCIEAPEGCSVWGSDMSGLEDRMKSHYIYKLDPEYVKDIMTDDFDPHLSLAGVAGVLTEEQIQAHKDGTENYKEIRDQYKTANYLCQFGGGARKLSASLGSTLAHAKAIHKTYWKRNWAVKEAAKGARTKQLEKHTYLLNPVNGFYYYLSNDKDVFSSWCQSGGAYVVDIWVYYMRKMGLIPSLTYHDEGLGYTPATKEEEEKVKQILRKAIELVNKNVDLNIELDIDIHIAKTYAEAH